MPRLAANLSFLWSELDFMDRFAAAAMAGFKGVEYLFPYEYESGRIAEQLKKHGLTQVLHNLPGGNWAGGERGTGWHPGRAAEFQDGVAKEGWDAPVLGCKQVNCLAGIRPPHVDPNDARETFIKNL